MKYYFLLVWGIFRKLQLKVRMSPSVSLAHAREEESFLFLKLAPQCISYLDELKTYMKVGWTVPPISPLENTFKLKV